MHGPSAATIRPAPNRRMASAVDVRTPATRPRHPACARPAVSSPANATGAQSAVNMAIARSGVAVTNAHNQTIIGGAPIIGQSRNYDLLFFHVDKKSEVLTAAPSAGEGVIAYGQGASGELREARGTIMLLNAPVEARCETCAVQSAFTFEGDAGPGFSGGPVVDAKTGRLVGITFGFLDPRGRRTMYAYPISRVRNELSAIEHKLPTDVD